MSKKNANVNEVVTEVKEPVEAAPQSVDDPEVVTERDFDEIKAEYKEARKKRTAEKIEKIKPVAKKVGVIAGILGAVFIGSTIRSRKDAALLSCDPEYELDEDDEYEDVDDEDDEEKTEET